MSSKVGAYIDVPSLRRVPTLLSERRIRARVKADERARRDALVWQMFLAGVSYREIGKNHRV